MENSLRLKRGLDLCIEGEATPETLRSVPTTLAAVVPDDFPGFTPKLEVKEGDKVEAGSPLLRDKNREEIKLCSPIAGTVTAVVRGERRKIERVVVTADNSGASKSFSAGTESPEDIRSAMMASGLWAEMRQRPFDIVPKADVCPRDIFVTAFDSAPLAPRLDLDAGNRQEWIDAGVKALAKLTDGDIYICTREECAFKVPTQAVHYTVSGPHPAGNPGIQAANIAPVNKGETIWTLDIVTVMRLGGLLLTGKRDFNTTIAVAGPLVDKPCYERTLQGAAIAPLLDGLLEDTGRHRRIISGNVLTGVKVGTDGFLRFPYRQITVIAEGDDVDEFMGWASVSPDKMSVSRSFPLRIFKKRFAPDARLLGGRRAMIMSGEYDKVLPMDIMPEYLLKAIGSKDIEMMEKLGIYEIAPEDLALCEYVDPSKTEIQKSVRQGLDWLRKELE
jgi:Na+-transporting NADH:ubiquinone oxidoreductase subunit A